MAEQLIRFFRDDFHILLSIMGGAYLIVHQVEKRRHWQLRMLLAFVVIAAWMCLTAVDDYTQISSRRHFVLGVIKYFGVFVLNVAAVMWYCRSGFYPALFAATAGYSLQHACERSWEIVRYQLNLPVWLDRLCLVLLMALALWLYDLLLLRKNGQRQLFAGFDRLNRRILLFLAVVVIAVGIVMDIHLHASLEGTVVPVVFDYSRATSAITSLLVLVICNCHLQETEYERRSEIADQLLHQEKLRYEQERDLQEAINIKCHDIRHQIAALGEHGYQKELRKIGDMVRIYDTAQHSENMALDVVLSGKSLACANKGIAFSCIADGQLLAFMADEDVYALFGNILDNAMEAVLQIAEPERRQISLSVRRHADFVLIEEWNFFEGELHFAGGLPQTSKADKDYHGFGTRSIQLLVSRYEGDIRFTSEEDIFRLSIMLPIPKASHLAA